MTRRTLRPAVIPQRQNRKNQYDNDKAVYKQRDIVERMFCRIKDWRRNAPVSGPASASARYTLRG